MYILAERYSNAQSKNNLYYCDTSADLKEIKDPPMGSTAYIIHEQRVVMADSTGKWYDM